MADSTYTNVSLSVVLVVHILFVIICVLCSTTSYVLSTIDEESDAGKQLLSEWTKAKCYLSTLTVFTAKVARPTCPSPTPKHIPSTKFGKESTFEGKLLTLIKVH
jgi:hypothetical protein